MLLALIFSALSASAPVAADSVRVAPKSNATRSDTTLPSIPAPTIALPTQSAPEVVLPIRPVTSIATPRASSPLSAAASQPLAGVVQQASASVATRATLNASAPARQEAPAATADLAPVSTSTLDAKPMSAPAPVLAAPSGSSDKAAAPAAAPASAPPASTSPTRDSATIKPPVVAPADAVASTAAGPRTLVTTTRVDPRTVVSVKSSERFEPLYAVPIPSAGVRLGPPAAADSIVVYKRERTLVLFNRGVPVRTYHIALGSKPVGDKERAGDQKTPEGLFYINAHNPASKFHLALRISYPSDAHRARAAALGVDPGGDIMIHGLPKEFSEAGKKHLQNDWTNGCVALSNQEIEEIWRAVPDGTPVQIKP